MPAQLSNDHPGFVLLPSRRPTEPGYAGLDIWLLEQPTGRHFDPSQIVLYTAGEHGIDYSSLEHPWSGETQLTAVCGPIDLIDHKGHHIEGFTFGGSLEIETKRTETKAVLRSPAPILLNTQTQTIRAEQAVSLLIEEFNILLARRKAFWQDNAEELEQRLAAANPLHLYAAFLPIVYQRFKNLPPSDDQAQLSAQHSLHVEMEAVAELIPGFELSLASLL